jgi:threonine/homoserine/homoserine lactone efflux protein
MPETTTLTLFALTAIVLIAIPGPNHIYITTRSLSDGRRAGLASAFGVEVGTLVHVTAAALGLSALLASSSTAFHTVKYAGAAYLLYLGIRTLLRRGAEHEEAQDAPSASVARAFGQGLVVNLLNPKTSLLFLAFLPQFIDPAQGSATTQIFVLGGTAAALGLTVDSLYAVVASAAGSALRRSPRFLRRQRYITGGIFLALGAGAALAGGPRRMR